MSGWFFFVFGAKRRKFLIPQNSAPPPPKMVPRTHFFHPLPLRGGGGTVGVPPGWVGWWGPPPTCPDSRLWKQKFCSGELLHPMNSVLPRQTPSTQTPGHRWELVYPDYAIDWVGHPDKSRIPTILHYLKVSLLWSLSVVVWFYWVPSRPQQKTHVCFAVGPCLVLHWHSETLVWTCDVILLLPLCVQEYQHFLYL